MLKLLKFTLAVLLILLVLVIVSPKNNRPLTADPPITSERSEKEILSLPGTSEIAMDFSIIENDYKPILNIDTNLPPRTILIMNIVNPINLGGNGYIGSIKNEVSPNQTVQFGPFSNNDSALSPGIYLGTVGTVGSYFQPEDVQSFFGAHGRRLKGPHIFILPGTSETTIYQKFRFRIDSDGSITNFAENTSSSDEVQQSTP